jgi:hypothetical protein
MKTYVINDFSKKCICDGKIFFEVVIGVDEVGYENNLAFIAKCDSCDRYSGFTSDMAEAFSQTQERIYHRVEFDHVMPDGLIFYVFQTFYKKDLPMFCVQMEFLISEERRLLCKGDNGSLKDVDYCGSLYIYNDSNGLHEYMLNFEAGTLKSISCCND